MLFLGFDPDLHTSAFATVDENMEVVNLHIFRVPATLKGREAVKAMADTINMNGRWAGGVVFGGYAVEAQEIYPTGPQRTKNPTSILLLGHISGAALCALSGVYGVGEHRYFPTPIQWKGSIPKIIHHRRILTRAGYNDAQIFETGSKEDGYCGLIDSAFNRGDWKHLTDAIGLAQWAANQYLNAQQKAKYLNPQA